MRYERAKAMDLQRGDLVEICLVGGNRIPVYFADVNKFREKGSTLTYVSYARSWNELQTHRTDVSGLYRVRDIVLQKPAAAVTKKRK